MIKQPTSGGNESNDTKVEDASLPLNRKFLNYSPVEHETQAWSFLELSVVLASLWLPIIELINPLYIQEWNHYCRCRFLSFQFYCDCMVKISLCLHRTSWKGVVTQWVVGGGDGVENWFRTSVCSRLWLFIAESKNCFVLYFKVAPLHIIHSDHSFGRLLYNLPNSFRYIMFEIRLCI